MNGWKPATKVTALCMGIVVLAAVFCFCFSRHVQIEYPLPKPISKSCQVAEQVRSDEDDSLAEESPLVFKLACLKTKSGSRAVANVRFKEAPWLWFSEQDGVYTDFEEADDWDELEEDMEGRQGGTEDPAGGFHAYTTWYFRADREDEAFADFIKKGAPAELKTAEITYDDGTKRQAKVGSIKLYPKAAANKEGGGANGSDAN